MLDITTLTNDELAAAANELIRRAVSLTDYTNERIYINIGCFVYPYDRSKYNIAHTVHLGSGNDELKIEGGNALELTERLLAMFNLKSGITPPQQIIPALAGPPAVVSPEEVYAQFEEVQEDAPPAPGTAPAPLDDDVPF